MEMGARQENRAAARAADESAMKYVDEMTADEQALYGAIRGTQFRRAEEREAKRQSRRGGHGTLLAVAKAGSTLAGPTE